MQTFDLSILDKINSRILQDIECLHSISFADLMTIQYASTGFSAFGFCGFNNTIQLVRQTFEIAHASEKKSTQFDK